MSMKTMKDITLICFLFIIGFLITGCTLNEEGIKNINQQIQNKYSSVSTFKYTVEETHYRNNVQTGKSIYTQMFVRPDKFKEVYSYNSETESTTYATDESGNNIGSHSEGDYYYTYICNQNTDYLISSESGLYQYDYIVPSNIESYCAYTIENKQYPWLIPSELADTSQYSVIISQEDYNGEPVIKATVEVLGYETEKYYHTYWFDINDYKLLKEEIVNNIIEGSTGSEADVNQQGNLVEYKTVKEFTEFYFDKEIPDSEFVFNSEEYQDQELQVYDVDLSEKLKNV